MSWKRNGSRKKAFIPIGTKHVFLKHTSLKIDQLSVWGAQDRADYYAHIEMTLSDYLPEPEGDRGALNSLIEHSLRSSGMKKEAQHEA